MKWYTGTNATGLAQYGEHLRAALWSAIHIGRLQPNILFDGEPKTLFDAMGRDDFKVHRCSSSLLPEIKAMPPTPGFNAEIATGAYLRLEIPHVEQEDEFVLYTDNDVLFTRKVGLSDLRPTLAAAAIEPAEDGLTNRCSGVLVLNILSLRREYDGMMRVARETLGTSMYDQDVYNIYLRGKWADLPINAHWKPFWGVNPSASIIHFIGPKFSHIREIASGTTTLPASHLLCWLYGQNPIGCRYYAKVGEHFGKLKSQFGPLKGRAMLLAGPLYNTQLRAILPV